MMRQKYHLLVDNNGKPVGGTWNYDAQNRKNANHISSFPKRLEHTRDVITDEVLGLVSARFAKHFGQCYPFNLAVTREQALEEANYFMEHFFAISVRIRMPCSKMKSAYIIQNCRFT